MPNLLLEQIEYKVDETRLGVWRRYVYPTGALFVEFKAKTTFLGYPLIHFTSGKSPETGKRVVARGILAVGRIAVGVLAVGHAAFGIIAVGQLGMGVLLGLGQASTGAVAIGQAAFGFVFGLGQLATGVVAIGQVGVGKYVLGMFGIGDYVWSKQGANPVAVSFFKGLLTLFLR